MFFFITGGILTVIEKIPIIGTGLSDFTKLNNDLRLKVLGFLLFPEWDNIFLTVLK